MIRIAFITNNITGGGGEQLTYLIEDIDKTKYSVYLYFHQLCDKRLITRIEDIAITRVNCVLQMKGFINLLWNLRKQNIAMTITCDRRAGLYGRIASWLLGIKNVHITHRYSYEDKVGLKRRLTMIAERLLDTLSNKVVTVSENIRQLAITDGVGNPHKIVTIHNGIDTIRFARQFSKEELLAKYNLPANRFYIGIVARVDPLKDFTMLIRAFEKVKKYHAEAELIVVGGYLERDQLYYQEIKDMVSYKKLVDYVHFMGEQNEVPELIAIFDIFVLTSRYEGLPISVIEAIAAGKPVIATNVGGLNELIDDNGILVPAGDANAMSNAICKLIDDNDLREYMGIKSREKAVDFDKSNMSQSYEQIIRDVMR